MSHLNGSSFPPPPLQRHKQRPCPVAPPSRCSLHLFSFPRGLTVWPQLPLTHAFLQRPANQCGLAFPPPCQMSAPLIETNSNPRRGDNEHFFERMCVSLIHTAIPCSLRCCSHLGILCKLRQKDEHAGTSARRMWVESYVWTWDKSDIIFLKGQRLANCSKK